MEVTDVVDEASEDVAEFDVMKVVDCLEESAEDGALRLETREVELGEDML